MFENYRIIEDCCYPRTLIALATALDMQVEELGRGGITIPGYNAAMSQRAPLPQGHPTDNDLARCAIRS